MEAGQRKEPRKRGNRGKKRGEVPGARNRTGKGGKCRVEPTTCAVRGGGSRTNEIRLEKWGSSEELAHDFALDELLAAVAPVRPYVVREKLVVR